jgi:hypothetical protein
MLVELDPCFSERLWVAVVHEGVWVWRPLLNVSAQIARLMFPDGMRSLTMNSRGKLGHTLHSMHLEKDLLLQRLAWRRDRAWFSSPILETVAGPVKVVASVVRHRTSGSWLRRIWPSE